MMFQFDGKISKVLNFDGSDGSNKNTLFRGQVA